jgi:hypothetical protein
MQDKKVSIRLGLSLLSVVILVPLISSVNHFARISQEQIKSRSLQADGAPIPPLPPPKKYLVADGAPIPPLPPPKGMGALVADGAPIPPLPPPKDSRGRTIQLLAQSGAAGRPV